MNRGTQVPVIQLKDPDKNRIAQWLDVTVTQGIAELSLPLSPEPLFGYYSIHAGDAAQAFSVDNYVRTKFDVSFLFPKAVLYNSEQFQLKTCGRYAYGKAVQGTYSATVCRKAMRYWWGSYTFPKDLCVKFSGKLDQSGCSTLRVGSHNFNLIYRTHAMSLEGTSTITDQWTGIKYDGYGRSTIASRLRSCSFLDADSNYKPGIPYSGTVKVVDANDDPLPNRIVYLTSYCKKVNVKLVSDENGLASFQLNNTAEWEGQLLLTAMPSMEDVKFESFFLRVTPDFWGATLNLTRFHSPSKSFLKLHSQQGELPCEGQRDVRVEYIIPNSALGMEAKHMELHYLVASKGSVKDSGSVEVPITSEGGGSSELRGEVSIKLALSADVSPTLRALAFISLPNGELVADSATFKLQRCFKNKVSVGFSPDEVLPGADVSLQVQAAAGSLCGLRVVDQSVMAIKPETGLTADRIHNLFPFADYGGYDARVQDGDDYGSLDPGLQRTTGLNSHSYMSDGDIDDVYSLLKDMRLKIVTSAEIKKPLRCREAEVDLLITGTPTTEPAEPTANTFRIFPPVIASPAIERRGNKITEAAAETIQAYFPETWMWELASVGDNGKTEVHGSAPDAIRNWKAGAFCMGPSGFGISPPTSLRAFQPFFVELTLPYSVVRGESFTLKASVFNYLKHCIKVQTTLQPSLELEQEPCADCQYSSCLCAEESKTFYWNLKASNLGEVNVTVRTEALNTQDMCNNEIPIVPKQGHSDTVIKPLLVQPGGVLIEKSHSSLICSPEGEERAKTKVISLKVPKNIRKGSERAYVTVLGDLMGTAMQNLDRLLAMPYGCGEQNMVLFAPNIFILQYLENTLQLTPEIQSKAKRFLESGYQRQLTYRRYDGSYSAFRAWVPQANAWLTAFVVKSFSKAHPYIFIDGDQLSQSLTWLKDHRKRNGCFQSVGKLFNNAMKVPPGQ
ncbi:alpha-2-macroglobulin-like protein 1 isoform X2 [Xenopus tropicalis]|uniref:Alpha-2-macroglobulin-like protein 1 isoform X2 n=1 Tax=Xenopus tropicalis TaxID=8364 RepID=A0A8J1JTN7_XENTR|nr:alpha-2-macroglobulin-like protein 1 isoform X2 [Xenopus tropicalis]